MTLDQRQPYVWTKFEFSSPQTSVYVGVIRNSRNTWTLDPGLLSTCCCRVPAEQSSPSLYSHRCVLFFFCSNKSKLLVFLLGAEHVGKSKWKWKCSVLVPDSKMNRFEGCLPTTVTTSWRSDLQQRDLVRSSQSPSARRGSSDSICEKYSIGQQSP